MLSALPADFIARVVDAMPDPVLVFDREGRYVYVNPAGERLTRQSKQALIGQRLGTSQGAPDPAFERSFQRLVADVGWAAPALCWDWKSRDWRATPPTAPAAGDLRADGHAHFG